MSDLPWGHALILVLAVASPLFSWLPSGFSWDYSGADANFTEGKLAMKLQWGSLFLIASIHCFMHRQHIWAVIADMNPCLKLMLFYCALTLLWSPFPAVTLKKAIQFLGTMMIGIAFQTGGLSGQKFAHLLWKSALSIQIASLIACIAFPNIGIEYSVNGAWSGGAWRGILMHKNEFGMLCTLSIIFQVVLISSSEIKLHPTLSLLALMLSLVELLLSKSTTSLLMMFVGVSCFYFFKNKLIQTPFVTSRFFLILLSAILISLHIFYIIHAEFPTWNELFTPFSDLLGKQADMTGRFDIWALVMPEIAKHWLLGSGYGAFWLGIGSPSQFIIDQLGWIPYQAHNGYLDVLNEQGVVGLSLLLGFVGLHIRDIYRLSRFDASQTAFQGTLLLIILVSNFSESSIFRGMIFFTTMLIYSSITVTSSLAKHQRAAISETNRT